MMILEPVFIVTILLLFAAFVWWLSYHSGYMDGQIDALTGKEKYFLYEFKDGSRKWYTESDAKSLKKGYQDFKAIKQLKEENHPMKEAIATIEARIAKLEASINNYLTEESKHAIRIRINTYKDCINILKGDRKK